MNPESDFSISGLAFPSLPLVPEPVLHSILSDLERFHLDGKLPEWADAEMGRLYQSIFSSAIMTRVSGQADGVSTYVNKVRGETTFVLLFRKESDRVRVLNELIRLHPDEIRDFVVYVFTAIPGIRSITFNAIKTDALNLPWPCQRHNQTEDLIIDLPASSRHYQDSLGKNLRKNIRRYSERIKKDFPAFEFVVANEGDVRDEHILSLIEFNRARMKQKNKVSGIDEAETRWFLDCVRHFGGMAVLAVADGKICAGLVCCCAGDHFFLLIVGHDPAWNDYSLGTLCYYRAICEAIERGGKACHFLWGREAHKYRLLGVQHDFDKIVVYHSHAAMLRDARHAVLLLAQAKMRQARLWLLDPANQDKPLARMANRLKRALSKASS